MSLLEIQDVTVRFGHGRSAITAVKAANLALEQSSVLGIVGESGSGKSTLARAVVGLAPMSTGRVLLEGSVVRASSRHSGRGIAQRQRSVQMVFQDPYASLDPRMPIQESVAEGVRARGGAGSRRPLVEAARLLSEVGIDPSRGREMPRHLSGGQRQRVAIARALAARPKVLIADEITSALDVSVQGATLNLLRDLQRDTGIAIVFISHNIAVVRYMANQVAVMKDGEIVEFGDTDDVMHRPRHEYTRALLTAVPTIRPRPQG